MTTDAQDNAIPPWLAKAWKWQRNFAGVLLLAFTVIDILLLAWFGVELLFGENSLNQSAVVSKWAVRAFGAVVIAPLFVGVCYKLNSDWKGTKPPFVFHFFFVVWSLFFFGGMYWMESRAVFDPVTGDANHFYSIRLDGRIKTCLAEGIDPETGRPCMKITPQVLPLKEDQEAGRFPSKISPDGYIQRRHDVSTGAPVWYARHADGHFGLYDRAGFDGVLAVMTQPVTPEIDAEIVRWIEGMKAAERSQAAAAAREARAAALEVERNAQREKEARAAAERLAFIERYIDRGSRRIAGMSNVAVQVIDSNDANSESVANAMDRALRARGFNVMPLFKPAFGDEGLDRQLFDGNTSLAQRLTLAEHCDSVVIGSVRMLRAPRKDSGMYITEMALQLRQISSTGSRLDQWEVRKKGGAHDANASISAAIERLAESAEVELAAWPRT